ncbi:DEAD/DEAH box helicase family protein [Natronosalvus halobius]|uniref:DEAD/DEAH box helicase family protein n=1 Tax=Natronosalvus halobius TaxID=2953746 RepID=UPI00209E0FA0|nr:DEAD/DEAH box helicase family protein [Natronosalvus halobius]USZ73181.1 DEAD/DEAH box helicase family protein [Natronosalvus halobius]
MENFDQKLVLTEYLYSKFGADSFDQFRDALNDAEEGFKADNRSRFVEQLTTELEPTDWLWEHIEEYDRNISEYERRLAKNREENIRLKYFQYLSLLFTEIYLDLYYNYEEKLREEFSFLIEDKRAELDVEDLYPLEEDTLSKLAYWMATGSGKTLIMHANLWQFQRYSDQEPANVLLITPNEGLTDQHLEEFEASGIDARRFSPERNSSSGTTIDVLDIHKISDETGEKTYAVDTFEGDNLVFVDEGHKGAQGDQWITYREQVIGDGGFSFEYSATFGQALSSIENEQLQNRYVQSIIFDYSFRNFHVDGFGKEYDILNLAEETELRRGKYLTANLLSFYEQKKYYVENEAELAPFNLENPLWIFVGQTVNAVSGRTITKKDKASDVETVVRFLARFLRERDTVIYEIEDVLSGTEFVDEEGRSLFENKFDYLEGNSLSADEIYDEILDLVFNASSGAELSVVHLKNAENEIGLRVGRNEKYFGLISIGSTRKFIKRIEENTQITTEEQEFKRALFTELNSDDSNINVLIGAKKFTDGWDSYRVASMGLMRVGRSEGSEIIQIFGRGIRLRGMNNALKRSSYLEIPDAELPEHIHVLERLNVFGIKADYIKDFEAQLQKENIPTRFVRRSVETTVKADLLEDELPIPRKREDAAFVSSTSLKLPVSEEHAPAVDLYSNVQTLRSSDTQTRAQEKYNARSEDLDLDLVDWDRLLIELIDYKQQQGYSNLILDVPQIETVIRDDHFTLTCPESRLHFDDPIEAKVQTEEVVRIILRSYVDNVFSAEKSDWEDKRREYQLLQPDDPELNFELTFRVPEEPEIVETMNEILALDDRSTNAYRLEFDRSLYDPLFIKKRIEAEDREDRLKAPVQALNEGEQRLVERLDALIDAGTLRRQDVYLLRNPQGTGIGFEQGGYPDFILWIKSDDKQTIIFLDPHGMVFEPEDIEKSNKVKLNDRIKALEDRLDDPHIEMRSYVISVTDVTDLRKSKNVSLEKYEEHNVYFQNRGYLKKILLDAGVNVLEEQLPSDN